MDIYQAFFQYANNDIEYLSQLKGRNMRHSTFGECVIQDFAMSKDNQNVNIHLYSHTLRIEKIIGASFFCTNSGVCLNLDFPQEIIPLIEAYARGEISKRKTKQELHAEFKAAILNSCDSDIGLIPETPHLNNDDVRLVGIWKYHVPKEELKKYLSKPLPDLSDSKDPQWGRLLSARAAEKVVFAFLEKSGYQVRDISISQIDLENNEAWKQYDLIANDIRIDVKNGRNTKRRDSDSVDTYIDFCVPEFKHDKRSDQDIWIAGVMSPYLWASSFIAQNGHNISTGINFLGITRRQWIEELSQRFCIPDHFEFLFSRKNNSYSYLPPWAFVYPDRFYAKRDNALEILYANIHQPDDILGIAQPSPLPIFLAKGIDPFASGIVMPEWAWEKSFAELIVNWTQEREYRHALPFLFASVFHHFIKMALAKPEEVGNFTPNKYRKFLYVFGLNKFPLMIHDPLDTINNLIKILDTLWEKNHQKLLEFKFFKLKNALILYGFKNANDKPTTLMSYCGGRLAHNKSSCGYFPLIAGLHEVCDKCGHIICPNPNCHFCSYECHPNGFGINTAETDLSQIENSHS